MRQTFLYAIAIGAATSLSFAAGCTAEDKGMNQLPGISADIKRQLSFVCVKETDHIPPRDAEAEQLYAHARWLIKKNILKQDRSVFPKVERLLRIATAYGHDKANIELRGMLEKGQAVSTDPVNEVIDLVQSLIKRGIPAGFYDMGWYLEHGYGVQADKDLAFKYYRKSADLGSPDGQYLVGDRLSDERLHGSEIGAIGWSMYRCASDQGHAKAASEFGIYLKQTKRHAEALKYFQRAVSAGNSGSALSLAEAFSSKNHSDEVFGLGQPIDIERQARYTVVAKFLSDYEYLNPVVPEIDEIIPLPPGQLPLWDGKFRWLETLNSNITPPLPTEARIAEMAVSKGLDSLTGRPKRSPP